MDNNIYENVKEYYGKILKTTKSLKTSACTMSNRPSDTILNILKKFPNDMLSKSWLSKYFTVYGDKSVHYGLFKDSNLNEENIEIKSSCC